MDPATTTPETPATIRVARLGDEAGIARAHIAGWRVAYRDVIHDASLDTLPLVEWTARWRERLEAQDANPTSRMDVCFVAVDAGGEIIGFAHGGKARRDEDCGALAQYDAELYAIYLLAGMQGRGVGRRLARASAS